MRVLRRASVLCLLAMPAPPAHAFCLLGCDTIISDPVAATTAFETQLGRSLPDQVIVEHIRQGGFQDRFIQVLITTNQVGADQLLPLLGLSATTITPVDPAQFGPPGPDWWQPQDAVALFGGPGQLQGYAETMVAIAPFPGTFDQITIYIFAVQT
jgi:hypothetical protein